MESSRGVDGFWYKTRSNRWSDRPGRQSGACAQRLVSRDVSGSLEAYRRGRCARELGRRLAGEGRREERENEERRERGRDVRRERERKKERAGPIRLVRFNSAGPIQDTKI